LYYTDRKVSSTGHVVEVDVFDRPKIDTLRNLLDDIAKEVGGRKHIQEVSGSEDKPLVIKVVKGISMDDL
jgi:hypothetical protein